MTNAYQTETDTDDALGLAMRAFVAQSLSKGASCEDIIFALALETIRTALDLHADRTAALRLVLSAVSSVATKIDGDLEP